MSSHDRIPYDRGRLPASSNVQLTRASPAKLLPPSGEQQNEVTIAMVVHHRIREVAKH